LPDFVGCPYIFATLTPKFRFRKIPAVPNEVARRARSMLVGDAQHDEQREEGYAMMLRRKEADGLIFSTTESPPWIR
jgi:DNA-binding LacI/PurR family transcriptional regulator